MERLLSISEAADLLNLKRSTLYKYVTERCIPFTKIGARVLFKPESLKDWVEAKSVPVGGR